MSFIGIITNKSNKIDLENKLKNIINSSNNIITLKAENVSNIKNIKFDTVIINYELYYNEEIRNLLKNTKNILMNADIKIDLKLFDNLNAYVITYGFNKKSTITVISVEQDEIILDIQRDINNINNKNIESKEIKINSEYDKKYFYEEIVCKIMEILYG